MTGLDDVLALRSRPLPRYGDVVQRWDMGVGMIYAVTKDGSLMIAFESGCICCGYQCLEYLGNIYELAAPLRPVANADGSARGERDITQAKEPPEPRIAGVPPQRELE